MAKTKIEWATHTWNPITGCTPVSEGCQNCYAARMARSLAGRAGYPKDDPFRITLHEDRLDEPLRWRKHRMVFVCSMGDLFHEDVLDKWIDQIFGTILGCKIFNNVPEHTFLILTKRPGRMKKYLTDRTAEELLRAWANLCPWHTDNPDVTVEDLVYSQVCHDWDSEGRNSSGSKYKPWGYLHRLWPLPNVWLGVTAENQQRARERIPILLKVPAAVRFVSVEPMLSRVDLEKYLMSCKECGNWGSVPFDSTPGTPLGRLCLDACIKRGEPNSINWVICGGETGPDARPMHPGWVRWLVEQCQVAGIPFFFKSWGDWYPDKKGLYDADCMLFGDTVVHRVGKKHAGRLLDGREWNEMPERKE